MFLPPPPYDMKYDGLVALSRKCDSSSSVAWLRSRMNVMNTTFLSLFQINSIGLRPGKYGTLNTKAIPNSVILCATALEWWAVVTTWWSLFYCLTDSRSMHIP